MYMDLNLTTGISALQEMLRSFIRCMNQNMSILKFIRIKMQLRNLKTILNELKPFKT